MGYTHYFRFQNIRGKAQVNEIMYKTAIEDCQKIIRRFYKENGGLSGYTAHCKIGAYGGVQVNGKRPDDCEPFELREHFSQNLENDFSGFCKTARLPYDTVVVACLAVLKHRLGDAITISSDGNAKEWLDGVEFARQVTRLKIANPIPMVKNRMAG